MPIPGSQSRPAESDPLQVFLAHSRVAGIGLEQEEARVLTEPTVCRNEFSQRNLGAQATQGLSNVNLCSHGNWARKVSLNWGKQPAEPWEEGVPRLHSTRRPGKQWGSSFNLQWRGGGVNWLQPGENTALLMEEKEPKFWKKTEMHFRKLRWSILS